MLVNVVDLQSERYKQLAYILLLVWKVRSLRKPDSIKEQIVNVLGFVTSIVSLASIHLLLTYLQLLLSL